MKSPTIFGVIALTLAAPVPLYAEDAPARTKAAAITGESPVTFTAGSGETVEAYEGSFAVPENRVDPESRMLTLRYVRFPATADNPGPPIVYLAGGPGGSGIGTAKGRRFPLFMAMRQFGDVIAFDQRGTGASDDLPVCTSSQKDDPAVAISDAEYDLLYQSALRECLDFWTEKGIDVRGYTTRENAADLDDLRRHLGAEKISLWGISYGSHLALAAVKQMPERLDKVVIASGEGLDQTIKLPARTDAYFARLQQAVDSQPDTKAALGEIIPMMRRVHARLEAEPLVLDIPAQDGGTRRYVIQRRDMQETASALISDPASASLLLQIYASLDRGDTSLLMKIVPYFASGGENIRLRPMQVLTDIASGTSPERRALIAEQAKTSLLGPYLNQSVTMEDVDPSLVMDESFRMNPDADIPLLLLTGTLDGRTYIESQREAVSAMPARQMVLIRNAGHNLFMSSPEVTATILQFMRGENVDGREITAELPDLLTAGFEMMR